MIEQLFYVLADGERRELVRTLAVHDRREQTLTVADVSDVVGPSTTRLHHVHLPKLADAEIVTWNRERGEIEAGPRFDEARRLLERVCIPQGESTADA